MSLYFQRAFFVTLVQNSIVVFFLIIFCFLFCFFTGGELLKYTYTLFGGNYCLNGQKNEKEKKKKITVILGFLVAETSRKHHHWHFWANPSQWWGQCGKMNNFLVT